jgi:ubiquinone/menaquinone biosynthesis C-methylase UbiE
MANYHKFVFDTDARRFIGKFDEMYQQERVANFDSWHQEDSRQLNRKIALNILSCYNFETVIDIGSGKGVLTHQLKKRNNHVLGLDISPTAIEVARARYPDIEFDIADVNDLPVFTAYLDEKYDASRAGGGRSCFFSRVPLLFGELESFNS